MHETIKIEMPATVRFVNFAKTQAKPVPITTQAPTTIFRSVVVLTLNPKAAMIEGPRKLVLAF